LRKKDSGREGRGPLHGKREGQDPWGGKPLASRRRSPAPTLWGGQEKRDKEADDHLAKHFFLSKATTGGWGGGRGLNPL